jgi:hypothetical protein
MCFERIRISPASHLVPFVLLRVMVKYESLVIKTWISNLVIFFKPKFIHRFFAKKNTHRLTKIDIHCLLNTEINQLISA